MRIGDYERLLAAGVNRRHLLKTGAALGAVANGLPGFDSHGASAQESLRTQILQIPGVGAGSPTDADWQKVGELYLGATKANVAQGEFAGIELPSWDLALPCHVHSRR